MNLVFLLQWNKNSLFQCHKAFLTRSVINEVRTHLPFTQVRSYWRKRQARNFHVTTVTNSIGKTVVEYFSCRTDVRLVCCNGEWQVEISRREKENGVVRVGKWGLRENQDGLSRFAIFNPANYYWLLPDGSKVCCDEPSNAVFWWVLLVDLVFLLQFLLIVPVAYFGSLFHWEVNRLEIHIFQ